MDKAAEERGLSCPECGGKLKEVYAEATYGRFLLLDQCRACGGVWFDKWELYFVKAESIKALEEVDLNALVSPVAGSAGSDKCPKCNVDLIPFNAPLLPKDASIKRCQRCSGLWLNRGELGKYARHRESFKKENGLYRPGLETLKHLQKELDVSNISAPSTLDTLQATSLDEPPIEPKELAKDVGFLVLQALLRLVFKF
ncbi:MAG: zf-TFIIB domain-containing protein [Deltaproteobacteria bacterium]|nr:zf-TFIIB domain-containing protein [Deltaproteobacteria bacterium]